MRTKLLQRALDQVARDSTPASERVVDDEQSLAQHLTFEALILSIDAARARSVAYQRALAAARPRLILETQRALAQGREVAITVLGRLRAQPGDGAEALLVGLFEDAEAPAQRRLLAARALRESPLAPEQRERLLGVLGDVRPLVRAWALRLVDDSERWAIGERDPSELVRELARGRARS